MKRRTLTSTMPRLVLMSAVGVVLASCGGSGGDDGAGAGQDENLDGIPDVTLDSDLDNDGEDDVDIDGDGRADFDVNQDGIRDFDADNDGSVDQSVLDEFGLLAGYSTNGNDGVAEVRGDGTAIDNTPPPTALSCPSGGEDATSANDEWADNCTLRSGVTSYYTRGVQRILDCIGIDTLTDAQYGQGTIASVRAYQQDVGITDDGIVGAQTWGRLREELEAVADTADPVTRDLGYRIRDAVNTPACGNQIQFYRTLRDGSSDEFGGWTIADNAGSETRVEFSVRNPFQ